MSPGAAARGADRGSFSSELVWERGAGDQGEPRAAPAVPQRTHSAGVPRRGRESLQVHLLNIRNLLSWGNCRDTNKLKLLLFWLKFYVIEQRCYSDESSTEEQ